MDEDFYNEIIQGGGSGNGSGSGDNGEVIYYKLKEPYYINLSEYDYFQKNLNVFSAARGYYDKQIGYYYGSVTAISGIVGAKYSTYPYIDALEFRPTQYLKSWSDMSIVTYKDYETLVAAFPDIFIPLNEITRITAEEYWEHFKE